MTIVKYRPRTAFVSPFNELVNGFFGRDISQFLGSDDARHNVPSVNIVERDEAFDLRMLAPGFSREELKVGIENDVLTISGERKAEDLKENERYTRREFSSNSFSRGFRLPETVNAEGVKAEFVNGVLHVSIPKAEAAKPRTREIGIN